MDFAIKYLELMKQGIDTTGLYLSATAAEQLLWAQQEKNINRAYKKWVDETRMVEVRRKMAARANHC